MKFETALLLILTFDSCNGFSPLQRPPSRNLVVAAAAAAPNMDGGGGGDSSYRKSSRLDGNQRDPTASELSIMDDMINKLANAKPYELPNAIRRAFRVCSSPRFFLRIAERADQAVDDQEKEKLAALASNLVATLEAVVSTTEEQLDERAKDVESVVKAAAEPDSGEFMVPLLPSRIEAMRKNLLKLEPSSLDEGFLSTVDAWMNKSHQDGMDGMVAILQKVLQLYAGLQVFRARAILQGSDGNSTPASILLDKLLQVDTDIWNMEIKMGLQGNVTPTALIGEVQRTMETVVLGLENGTMSQRVQAEYLRELVSRIEAIQK